MKNDEDNTWQVYLLECADETLYCGVTKNLCARIRLHNLGRASKYTRSRLPVACVAKSPFMTKQQAFRLEYETKRLDRKHKISRVLRGMAVQTNVSE